ncbi:hypothetical protein WJX72_008707 [[Myrmecia] bisecta]|uniref:Uncharacterized protein n=1 Tax=[Myrmecia] bisecta TaxID=41462 RepID=A0AAW1Q2A0_9CHLO
MYLAVLYTAMSLTVYYSPSLRSFLARAYHFPPEDWFDWGLSVGENLGVLSMIYFGFQWALNHSRLTLYRDHLYARMGKQAADEELAKLLEEERRRRDDH